MQAARGVVFASKCSAARPPTSNKLAVFIENSVHGSNIRWRGRSVAASIPSDSSQSQRSRKRLSKHERRTMVETFVHKYRASNAGKFPTTSFIKKQIGGSYYVTKRILQELEHEYKVSPVNKRDEFLLEKAERVTSRHFDAKDKSQVSTGAEEISRTVKHVEATSIHFETKEEPWVFNLVEKTSVGESINIVTEKGPCSEEVIEVVENFSTKGMASSDSQLETGEDEKEIYPRLSNETLQDNSQSSSGSQEYIVSTMRSGTMKSAVAPSKYSDKEDFASHQVRSKSAAEVLQPLLEQQEDRINDASASKILQNSDGPKGEIIQEGGKEGPESQKFHRDISKTLDHKEEPLQTTSTFWGNLKSLADDIMSFWKKR